MTKQNMNNKLTIFLVIIASIVAFFGYAGWSDSSRNREIEATHDAARLAYLLLDYSDGNYKSLVISNSDEITITFNLGEYSAGSEITFLDEAKYVYSKFFNTFKDKNITIIGNAIFTGIKGNKSKDKAFLIKVTSGEAKTINWENVEYQNLPSIVSSYWKNSLSI